MFLTPSSSVACPSAPACSVADVGPGLGNSPVLCGPFPQTLIYQLGQKVWGSPLGTCLTRWNPESWHRGLWCSSSFRGLLAQQLRGCSWAATEGHECPFHLPSSKLKPVHESSLAPVCLPCLTDIGPAFTIQMSVPLQLAWEKPSVPPRVGQKNDPGFPPGTSWTPRWSGNSTSSIPASCR